MTCKEIIEDYLRKNKFDGLFNPLGECACPVEDLMPCGELCDECEPGYEVPCDCGEHDYHIAAKKNQTPGVCRVCGCTDDDCRQCIEKTGEPCHWVEPDLCSACAEETEEQDEEIPGCDGVEVLFSGPLPSSPREDL